MTTVTNWLVSEFFGLKQARSREAEEAIEAAEAWMRGDRHVLPASLSTQDSIHRRVCETVPGHDPFWPRWIVQTSTDPRVQKRSAKKQSSKETVDEEAEGSKVIRVERAKEPQSFAKVRRRGSAWLSKNPAGDPPSYWRDALPDLQAAFSHRCGYSAMHDLSGTVDHFVPRSRDRSLAYAWTNLRYASHWINASKGDREGIVDPFEVEDGWFEVILPSLQLVVSDDAPARVRKLLQATLDQLPIGHDERIVRQRRAWLSEYLDGNVTLDGLRRFAPLVAAAVER